MKPAIILQYKFKIKNIILLERKSKLTIIFQSLVQRLHQCLGEIVYWDEIAVNFTKLLQEARDFVATLKHYKLDIDYEKYSKVSGKSLVCFSS